MEWTAAIARAVINPRHGVYEVQDGHFMERTHLPLKLHLPASVTIGGCMSKEAIEQKEVIVGKLKDSGCRITKQRLILLDVILEGECGSCKEIYYRASKIDHSIGTATVYRMINTLEEIGAIDRKICIECRCHKPDFIGIVIFRKIRYTRMSIVDFFSGGFYDEHDEVTGRNR